MSGDGIYAALGEIFADIFLRDDLELTPETSAQDVEGWDSFKQIEIIIAIERRFGIELSARQIDGLKCVGDLFAVISKRAGGLA